MVYELISGAWTRILDKTLGVDSAGVATLNVKFASTGEFYVRSLALPTTFNANSVWSPVERYHSV